MGRPEESNAAEAPTRPSLAVQAEVVAVTFTEN